MSEAERIYTTTFEKFKDIAIGQQQVATLCLHNKIRESFDFFLQVVEELELKGDQNNQYTNWCLENFVAFKGKRNELSETQKRTLALAILLTKKSATIKQELCPPRAVESPFQVRYTRQVSNQPIVQLYCFNTNGLLTFALATQDGFVRIYNEAPQLEMKMNTRVHTNNICFLGSLKGSNNLLISASTDGVIALWNATSCNFYTNFCVSDHVSQMTTLPNDKIAIINKHAEMEIWCTLQKTLIEKFHSHSKSLASFSDGMILSVIDQPNIITASYILSNISSSRYFLAHAPVTLFATHSSGFFASATADHVIAIWHRNKMEKEALAKFTGHTKEIVAMKFLSNNLLVSSSTDFTIKFWDLTTKQCIQTIQTGPYACSLERLSDTSLLAGFSNGYITIYDKK